MSRLSSSFRRTKALFSAAGLMWGLGLLFLGSVPNTARAADPVTCSASAPGGINFGTVNALNPVNTDVTGSLNISCVSQTNTNYYVTVCFNIGNGQGPVMAGLRTMKKGTDTLNYQLYSNASRSQVWGSIASTNFPTPVRLDFYLAKRKTYNQTLPIYARLFGAQTASPVGSYSDSYVSPVVQITGVLSTTSGGGDCSSIGTDAGAFSSFNVVATVQSNCSVAATDLDFGSASSLSAAVTTTSTIQVQCTNKVPYQVGLNNGTHAIGTTRYMQSGANTIAYGLYQTAAHTLVWNNTTNLQSGTGTGQAISHTVFGLINPQPLTKAGNYGDTVQVNVSY